MMKNQFIIYQEVIIIFCPILNLRLHKVRNSDLLSNIQYFCTSLCSDIIPTETALNGILQVSRNNLICSK